LVVDTTRDFRRFLERLEESPRLHAGSAYTVADRSIDSVTGEPNNLGSIARNQTSAS
jgi:hypothetical protein